MTYAQDNNKIKKFNAWHRKIIIITFYVLTLFLLL